MPGTQLPDFTYRGLNVKPLRTLVTPQIQPGSVARELIKLA
jgi:hypothetical protein